MIGVYDQGAVAAAAAATDPRQVAGAPYLVMELAAATLADAPPPRDYAALRALLVRLPAGAFGSERTV